MGTIVETRLANLLALAAKYRFSREFCEAAGISPSYFSQLRSRVKTLGNTLARDIESRLNLENGALNEPVAAPAPVAPAGLQPETLTAAYAMQSMDPSVRGGFVRLILAVAATQAPAEPAVQMANNFEMTYAPPAASESHPVPASRRSK